MRTLLTSALLLAAAHVANAQAPATNGHAAHHGAAATAAEMTDGEIRRIDRDQRKMTLRHGEMKNLDMPPMTMVFQLADPAWIDQFKVGDKVRFAADKINGAYTVVKIEKAS